MIAMNNKLAQPYAMAFLEFSLDAKQSLDTIIADLTQIKTILHDSLDLAKTLSNPLLSIKAKKEVIKAIFETNISKNTLKFLLVLCDRGRSANISSIVDNTIELAYKKASIEIAYVTTANYFSSNQQEALVEKLKSMTSTEQIKLNITVDKTLIGGFKVQIGSKVIDTSIQGQLRQLAAHLGSSAI